MLKYKAQHYTYSTSYSCSCGSNTSAKYVYLKSLQHTLFYPFCLALQKTLFRRAPMKDLRKLTFLAQLMTQHTVVAIAKQNF
jgi:hypothetical protein